MSIKDKISNVVAVVLVVGGAVQAYLESTTGDINYLQLGVAILAAVIAWFTGKTGDLKGSSN